jgi:hypothetical protein
MRPLARRDLALLRQLDHVDRWGMANIKVYCRPSQQHAVWQRSRNPNQKPADHLDGVDFEALHINLTRP